MAGKRVEERPLLLAEDRKRTVAQWIPIWGWIQRYQREDFFGDLLAGVILTAVLVPQGMAYAMLAGLPPEMGLYASLIPTFIYGIFGTSRVLSVAPVAVVSLMVGSALGGIAEIGSAEYIQLAISLALLSGLLQLLLGGLRIGFLVNFLSYPVLIGFTSAAALIIAASQIKHLLGISIPRVSFLQTLYYLGRDVGQANWVSCLLGGGSLLVLSYFKYKLPKQLRRVGLVDWLAASLSKGGALVVMILGILIVWQMDWVNRYGVSVVGEVPIGLPHLYLPTISLGMGRQLLLPAITITLVGYIQSISVAKLLATRQQTKIEANQELLALGLANVGSALSGGFPVTGGFSRSVVNFSLGARTGLASMITAVLIGGTVIYLTPIFYYLPQATLAAIILMAVSNLFDWDAIKSVWQYSKGDGWGMVITFASVLLLGVDLGILIGIAFVFGLFVWRATHPQMVELLDIKEPAPQQIVVRVESPISFVNIHYIGDALRQTVLQKKGVRQLILLGGEVYLLDKSGAEGLLELKQELQGRGVTFYLVGLPTFVRAHLERVGFVALFGESFILEEWPASEEEAIK